MATNNLNFIVTCYVVLVKSTSSLGLPQFHDCLKVEHGAEEWLQVFSNGEKDLTPKILCTPLSRLLPSNCSLKTKTQNQMKYLKCTVRLLSAERFTGNFWSHVHGIVKVAKLYNGDIRHSMFVFNTPEIEETTKLPLELHQWTTLIFFIVLSNSSATPRLYQFCPICEHPIQSTTNIPMPDQKWRITKTLHLRGSHRSAEFEVARLTSGPLQRYPSHCKSSPWQAGKNKTYLNRPDCVPELLINSNIADHFNVTLVSLTDRDVRGYKYGFIAWTTSGLGQSVSGKMNQLFFIGSVGYQPVYCADKKSYTEGIDTFGLLRSFQLSTWLAIVVCYVVVLLFQLIQSRLSGGVFGGSALDILGILTLLAAITFRQPIETTIVHSLIVFVFSMNCLAMFYENVLTRSLIIPPKEEPLQNLGELKKEGYTLLLQLSGTPPNYEYIFQFDYARNKLNYTVDDFITVPSPSSYFDKDALQKYFSGPEKKRYAYLNYVQKQQPSAASQAAAKLQGILPHAKCFNVPEVIGNNYVRLMFNLHIGDLWASKATDMLSGGIIQWYYFHLTKFREVFKAAEMQAEGGYAELQVSSYITFGNMVPLIVLLAFLLHIAVVVFIIEGKLLPHMKTIIASR